MRQRLNHIFLMSKLLLQQGDDTEAVAQLHTVLQLDPNNLEMLLLTINVRAADENPPARNGRDALVLAERLVKLTGGQQPAALDALAMACLNRANLMKRFKFSNRPSN